MTIQEFLDAKPTKEVVAHMLCKMSNHVLFGPPWELRVWRELAEYAGLTRCDFWEDADMLSPMDYLNGQTAWRYKNGQKVETDEAKFRKLAEEAKKLHEELLAEGK